MIKSKIFFVGKKNDKFSSIFLKILKKNFTNVNYYFCKNIHDNLKKKIKNWTGDYIFCFRSYILLNNNDLSKAKIASINFHPGPPKYRGVGCVNFAVLNQEKFYGSTVHLINRKIDNGKILDVLLFKINKKNSIDQILEKTYKNQILQLKSLIKKLKKKSISNFSQPKVIKEDKWKWSNKLYTRNDLNELYRIPLNISNDKLKIILRSTITKKFKPYVEMSGEKFYYYEKKK
jgi:methionyl-tRNA formyltransferase